MNGSPRDFPAWAREMESRVKAAARNAMRAAGEVRADIGVVKDDLDVIRDEIANTPGAAVPAAPVEMTAESSLSVNREGKLVAKVTINFPDVLFSTTGQPITVTEYELLGYEATAMPLQDKGASYPSAAYPGSTYPGTPNRTRGLDPVWTPMATSSVSGFTLLNLNPGQGWMFRVRAAGGVWSAPFRVETTRDTTPPPMPTAPTVEHVRGTLVVRWDGYAVTGAMPLDLDYVVLAGGPDPSPTQELYRFGREGGTYVVPGLDYYETWFFRLQAVDQSGNVSTWSVQASEYTRPMVDKDIILTELDAARTHLKNVDAGVSILPDTIITEHLRVTTDMSAAIGRFLEVDADMLKANDIWADNAWLGYAEAALVKADMFIGREFVGGTFTGTRFRSNPADDRGVIFDDEGLRAFDPSGRRTFVVDSETGAMSATGTFRSGPEGKQILLSPENATTTNVAMPTLWFLHPSYDKGGHISTIIEGVKGEGSDGHFYMRGASDIGKGYAAVGLGRNGEYADLALVPWDQSQPSPSFRLDDNGTATIIGGMRRGTYAGAQFRVGITGGLTGLIHPGQMVEFNVAMIPSPNGIMRPFVQVEASNGGGAGLAVEVRGATTSMFYARLHHPGTVASAITGLSWMCIRTI